MEVKSIDYTPILLRTSTPCRVKQLALHTKFSNRVCIRYGQREGSLCDPFAYREAGINERI